MLPGNTVVGHVQIPARLFFTPNRVSVAPHKNAHLLASEIDLISPFVELACELDKNLQSRCGDGKEELR